MRLSLYAAALAVCLSPLAISTGSAAPAGSFIPSAANGFSIQSKIQTVQYGGYCARLRFHCENKDELGEQGEGNCRRYKRECGWKVSYCENLRYRCNNKEHLDEVGNGNCRRYNRECGGGGYDN